MKRLISIITYVFFITGITYYIFLNPEIIDTAKLISIKSLFFVFILNIVSILTTSYLLRIMFLDQRVKIEHKDYISLGIVTKFTNATIPLKLSAVIKALYLKKVYGIKISNFTFLFVAQALISILTNASVAYLFIIYALVEKQIIHLDSVFYFTLSVLTITFMLIKITKEKLKKNKTPPNFHNCFFKSKKTISMIIFITIFDTLTTSLSYYFILFDISYDINLFDVFLLSNSSSFFSNINLTPGGLGLSEFASLLLSKTLYISSQDAILMVFINRIIIIICSAIILPLAVFYLLKNYKRKGNEIK